jgi:hypothetical protein
LIKVDPLQAEDMEQIAIQHDGELLGGFNEVLGQHMERLLGFKLGPAGMPLTVTTLACLALLSEREDDLKGSDAGTRYTAEGLLAELSDLGLREYGECGDILRQLTEKDYVRPVPEGGVLPNPVALRLEELLERIFPKMPGLNFVAYVTQTLGEVKTGRKALALALSQFDQTLTMQGVSVVKRKPVTPSGEGPPVLQRNPRPPISSPQTSLPPRPRLEPNIAGLKAHPPFETQGPRVLGSAASPLRTGVREFRMGEIEPDLGGAPETAPVMHNEPANAPNVQEIEEQPVRTEAGHTASRVRTETETEIAEGASGEAPGAPDSGDKASHSFDRFEAEIDDDASSDQEAPPIELDERSIEQQILAFEQELSLWCPMCNKDRVEASTTPTGRTFYKCASRDCHFVSWGRPLHHPCPRCRNPFLIQISDKSGRIAYKCPRATCHFYRLVDESGAVPDATGAPLRRVVRRRVVRRKS